MSPEITIPHCGTDREAVRNKVYEIHQSFGDIPDTRLEMKVVIAENPDRKELQVRIVNTLPGGGTLAKLSEPV